MELVSITIDSRFSVSKMGSSDIGERGVRICSKIACVAHPCCSCGKEIMIELGVISSSCVGGASEKLTGKGRALK